MSTPGKIAIIAAASIAIGVASAWVTMVFAGGGHGTYLPFALLFPFGFLVGATLPNISSLVWAVSLAQFPLYGVVVGWRWISRSFMAAISVVALCHVIGAGLSALLYLSH